MDNHIQYEVYRQVYDQQDALPFDLLANGLNILRVDGAGQVEQMLTQGLRHFQRERIPLYRRQLSLVQATAFSLQHYTNELRIPMAYLLPKQNGTGSVGSELIEMAAWGHTRAVTTVANLYEALWHATNNDTFAERTAQGIWVLNSQRPLLFEI